MSEDKKPLDPKTTARIVRLALEFSRQLDVLADECTGSNVSTLAYRLSDASDHLQRAALKVPGVKIAVFPEGEEGGAR